jgi:hypothetical protein
MDGRQHQERLDHRLLTGKPSRAPARAGEPGLRCSDRNDAEERPASEGWKAGSKARSAACASTDEINPAVRAAIGEIGAIQDFEEIVVRHQAGAVGGAGSHPLRVMRSAVAGSTLTDHGSVAPFRRAFGPSGASSGGPMSDERGTRPTSAV